MTEPDSPKVVRGDVVGGEVVRGEVVPGEGRRRGRRARIVGVVVTVALIAGAATFVVLWNRGSARPVTMEEARSRASTPGTDPSTDPSTGTAPLQSAPATAASVTDQSTDAPLLRPAPGVYRYVGEGTEHLDKPPLTQSQGPDIPGTVTHLEGGCWRLRVDYSTNHWQSWDYCPAGSGLTENAGEFFQRLDLVVAKVDTSSSYTCDPPVDAIRATQHAGDQWMQECRGTSSGSDGEVISSGPYIFVGPEPLDVGGVEVAALHYHRLRTLTGGQTGTEDVDVWFDAATGLPLRNQRVIVVHGSALGGVTYEETGSFQLTSMTPT